MLVWRRTYGSTNKLSSVSDRRILEVKLQCNLMTRIWVLDGQPKFNKLLGCKEMKKCRYALKYKNKNKNEKVSTKKVNLFCRKFQLVCLLILMWVTVLVTGVNWCWWMVFVWTSICNALSKFWVLKYYKQQYVENFWYKSGVNA